MRKTHSSTRRSKPPKVGWSEVRLSVWNMLAACGPGKIVATFDLAISRPGFSMEVRGIRLVRRGSCCWSVEAPYLLEGGQYIQTVDLPIGVWQQAQSLAVERWKLLAPFTAEAARAG